MREQDVVLTVVAMMIFAGVGVLWMAMVNRRAVREMEHRERLAMIQRGLVPAPETDPLGFEAHIEAFQGGSLKSERWRTAGTLVIGLGLALMVLLTFSADAWTMGLGIGGAFVVLGAAILLNGVQAGRSRPAPRLSSRRPFPGGPVPPIDPPSSLAP